MPGALRCGLCGALFEYAVLPEQSMGVPEEWIGQATASVRRWRRRYGTLALLSLVGVLPFFPITPLLGLVLGAIASHRIRAGREPREGWRLAVVGMLGGALWFATGTVLVFTAADFIRSAPFIPAPVRWFWTWEIG